MRSRPHAALRLAACLLLGLASGASAAEGEGERDPDPWQRMNRGTFAFNEGFDRWVLGPVGRGWMTVTPEIVRIGVENL